MNRLQYNYDSLIHLFVELIHVSSPDRRADLLGEAMMNLPSESLLDIKRELIDLQSIDELVRAAA